MISETLRGERARPDALRDIGIVASPIVVLGVLGASVGLDTLLGGAVVNLGYLTAIMLGGYILHRQGSSWGALGLSAPERTAQTAGLGVAVAAGGVVVFVATQWIALGILDALGATDATVDQSRFDALNDNPALLLLMVVLSWTTIAFGEELFYRAFFITRLLDHVGLGSWTAVVLGGVVFGGVHLAEGPVGVLSNGALGVLFGWVYLRSGRNLWITIIAHGLINTLRFSLLYQGAA